MYRITTRPLALALAATLLGGCAVTKQEVNDAATQRKEVIAKAQELITTAAVQKPAPLARIRGNYLGGQALAVSTGLSLPPASREVVFNCGPGATGVIEDVAFVIRKFTGISVRIDNDVGMPPVTQSGMRGVSPSRAAPLPTPLPTIAASPSGAVPVGVTAPTKCVNGGHSRGSLPLTFTGDLSDYLNQIAAAQGVYWQYANGEIHVYRRITRTFTLMVSPGSMTYRDDTNSSSAGGGAAGAATTSTGNFGATSSAQTTADYKPWDALDQAVKSMISPDGKYTLNQASGSLVVTDTQDVVDRIAAWVKQENAALTRQVAIEFREIAVQLNSNTEMGVDVDLIYRKLNAATGAADWVFKLDAPSTLTSSNAGTIGYNIAKPDSRLAGTNVALQALNSLGTVVLDQTRTMVTTNRVPGRLLDVTDRAYLASTTPSSSSLTGSGSPGLQPGLITYGDNLIVVPTIGENNTVLLQMFSQRSSLLEFNTASAGTGATFQQINTPVTARRKNGGNFMMSAGETLVIVGNDAQSWTNSDAHSVTGGSRKTASTRLLSVLLVTARVLQGV